MNGTAEAAAADPAARATRLWDALPWLLFAGLLAVSWQRWVPVFQDGGRELGTALRMARGQVLYRDFLFIFGPLPAYADGWALRLFGERLGVLVALRLLLAAGGVWLLQRLARRLGPPSVANAAVALVVASCTFLPNGCWIFPYGVAALWGMVGTWAALELALGSSGPLTSAVAATVGGLAAGTKIEILPAALVAVAIPLLHRRPRGEAIAAAAWATALGLAAYGLPVLVLGHDAVRLGPLGPTLHEPPYFRYLHANAFLSGTSPEEFFYGGGWKRILLPSFPFLALAALLAHLPGGGTAARKAFLLLAGVAVGYTFHPNEALHVLLPLAIVFAAAEWGMHLSGRRGAAPIGAMAASLAVGLVMLPALARAPILYGFRPYTAFASPLAFVFIIAGLGRRLRFPAALAFYVLGLTAGQTAERWKDYRRCETTRLETPRGTLVLESREAAAVTTALDAIEGSCGPEGRPAILPEGGVIFFLSGRLSALPRESFYPDHFGEDGEDDVIAALASTPPCVVVQVNRTSPELLGERLGNGFYERFWAALAPHLRTVREVGPSWDTEAPECAKVTTARVSRYEP